MLYWYNGYGDNMEKNKKPIKKLLKIAIEVIIVVLFALFIKDNFYIIKNKAEYIYLKYLQQDIRQDLVDNEYRKKQTYGYLKINTDTTIKNKEQIKDVIYTFLDAGWKEYNVRCDPDYLNCVNDVKDIVKNENYLYSISNFVHPFNTFETVETKFSSTGKITFTKESKYTEEQISALNKKVDEIYKENYNPKNNVRENIKVFHDYIINNTKYDKDKNMDNSSNAYGVLFDEVGVCSGYTDAMQLFLEKMNVKNYRIASNTHTWNLVYVEGNWLNLDLTWDDPIMSDGSDNLLYDYFLINTNDLLSKESTEHNFDETIYIEAKIK